MTTTTPDTPHDRLRTLPRAEVHVHLEGCLPVAQLEAWARRFGEPLPRPPEQLLKFEGLADFLHFLDWACGLVRSREELAEAAYGFSQRLAASGDYMSDAGKLYQAKWWTQSKPGSDGSWQFVCSFSSGT
mgnify:CR=1 FL=1